MVKRFTENDVRRVSGELLRRYGGAIDSMEKFLRSYDIYAKDSYLARRSGYIPTQEDGSFLDGSDPDNFCANVAVKVFRANKISWEAKEERREKLAPMKEVKELEGKPIREYGKAERVAGRERRASQFKFPGRQKGAIVYARRIKINTRYGKQIRYIDNRGHYVGVQRQKRAKNA